MILNISQRIAAFSELGRQFQQIANFGTGLSAAGRALQEEIDQSPSHNPWFTPENVRQAIKGLAFMLSENKLHAWLRHYPKIQQPLLPKTVAVIMAGNLPMVGFHDFLCVLLSGHHFLGKLSHQDNVLPQKVARLLCEIEPAYSPYIHFKDQESLDGFDAVIATGNNNSARYFDYYFGKYPHVIRKNRSSAAWITGAETAEEFQALASDLFSYFGLGCRNVSHLLVPKGFDLTSILPHFEHWRSLADHHKYFNNYEYHKAIMLINQIPHYDNGFALFTPNEMLASPVSVIHYQEYESNKQVLQWLHQHHDALQCVAKVIPTGSLPEYNGLQNTGFDLTSSVPHQNKGILAQTSIPFENFGQTQQPELWDYADRRDTMNFLLALG